jgi:hypothetical protein
MRMVQPPLDEIIRVVPVRHGFMTATGTMLMAGGVTRLGRLAAIRVGGVHRQRVLIVMTFVRVMQMAVVQIIDMALVLDRGVATARTVLVVVMLVRVMFVRHEVDLLLRVFLAK